MSPPGDSTSFGPFRLFPTARVIERNAVPLELGHRALDILIVLVEHAGKVVTHRELISRAWRGLVVEPGNLRVHISGLRKALGDTDETPRYIATVAGQGYCFIAPVVRASAPDPAHLSPAPPSAPVAHGKRALPPVLARMIGRDDIVRAIATDLRADRFVTIVAPGGMGKTTVAVCVAHAMEEEFAGMVCFVDIGAIKDSWLVPATIASTLGLAIQTEDALPPLMAFLTSARMLLVLDNCEHLIDAIAPLAERIFFDAPSVHILATSREAMRVEGEHARWLPPLASPVPRPDLKADEILPFPAVKLLVERAAASSHFELDDANAPLVADICARLDGLALALELVGGRVGTYGVTATLNLLNKHLDLHWPGRRTALPRHQTLHALLDWSYGLLAEPERLVLRRLSIFVGTFTLEGAQAVAADRDLSETQVISIVDHLVSKSLLSAATADDGVTRFRLLEITRVFAVNKLLESGEQAAIARRHAKYLVRLLDSSFEGHLEPRPDRRNSARREHLGDVRAALEWCFGKGLQETADPDNAALAVELTAASAPAFLDLSLLIECHKWSVAALELLDDATRGNKRELVLQESRAISSTWTRGNGEDVRTAIVRGLEIAQNLGETSHRLRLLTGMHVYLTRSGDFKAALDTTDELYAVARITGDMSSLTLADWLRGACHHFLGDQAAAKQSFETGFARGGAHNAQQFGVDYRIRALVPFARVLWLTGYPDRAAQVAREAIDEGVLSGEPVNVCFSLLYTSTVFLWLGDFTTARDIIEKLLTHANWQALVSIHAEGRALQGALLIRLGKIDEGITLLRSALLTLKARRQHILTSLGAAWLADGLATTGRFDEALALVSDALANAPGGAMALEAPELLRVQATILLSMPEPNESDAESCLMRSLTCARRQSALAWELRTAITLAQLRARRGRAAEARQLLSSRYSRFTEGFETSDLKAAKQLLEELDVQSIAT